MREHLKAPRGSGGQRPQETQMEPGGQSCHQTQKSHTLFSGQAAPWRAKPDKPQGFSEGKQECAQKKEELPAFDRSPG